MIKEPKEPIAIVGKGRWGKIISPYISEFFDIKDQFGCDPIKWGELLINKAIGNVAIITPPETHYSLVKQALEARKNVFCEKPLCLEYNQVLELEELSKFYKVKLFIDYTHTFSPSLLQILKELKEDDEIQRINVRIWKNIKEEINNPGRIYTALACHALSIINMFININKEEFSFETVNKFHKEMYSKRCSISVSLNGERKFFIRIFTKKLRITYNPYSRTTLLINKIKDGVSITACYNLDERNNLKGSVSHFKKVLEDKEPSNIETEKRISKILEEYY